MALGSYHPRMAGHRTVLAALTSERCGFKEAIGVICTVPVIPGSSKHNYSIYSHSAQYSTSSRVARLPA